jgi:hypothetical protein
MTTTSTNGRQRKSLAEQIDRLDSILDGLANALNESVAMAVKEAVGIAVREAVQTVLTEVLTNPELLAVLRTVVAQALPADGATAMGTVTPASPSRVLADLSRVGAWTRAGMCAVCRACGAAVRGLRQCLSIAWAKAQVARRFKWPLLAAVGIGTVAAVGVYFAGPYVAALAGWVAGFTTSLSVQAGICLWRLWASRGIVPGI